MTKKDSLTISEVYKYILSFDIEGIPNDKNLPENFLGLYYQGKRIIEEKTLNLSLEKMTYGKNTLYNKSGEKYSDILKGIFYSIKYKKGVDDTERTEILNAFLQTPVSLESIEYDSFQSIIIDTQNKQTALLNKQTALLNKQKNLLTITAWGVWLFWIFNFIAAIILFS
ncbi:MAG: hypothetical protein OXC03_07485 [Flavobacteriaceae bacterium]|nr:hypothetical protein [Flavobacteriaceae bacterium]